MEKRDENRDKEFNEKQDAGINEKIDVEDIMREIRAEIKKKGYKEKEVRFADFNISYADNIDVDNMELSIDTYKKQLLLLNIQKNVNTNKTLYADSSAGKAEVFFKKVFRKCARFYIEPLVKEQNEYNETNAMLMCQLYAALKRVEELEKKVAYLEESAQERQTDSF